VKRSFGNRALDFMGRAAFGGENGFVRNKGLAILAVLLGIGAIAFQQALAGIALLVLIGAVVVSDIRRYNREYGNG
jgi:hypothetical protein